MNTGNVSIGEDLLKVDFSQWDLNTYSLFLRCKKLPEYQLAYDWQHDSYTLSAPARFAHLLGVDEQRRRASDLPFATHLFDYQNFFTGVALEAKRYALWMTTGMGKTACGLEYARQVAHRTGGRVLIVTPLNILQQWIDEARRFYGDGLTLQQIRSREELRQWCAGPQDGSLGITNPEKFIPREGEDQKISEVNRLAGVVLDEASILKSGGGVIKWALIHSCKGIEYKLSLTATPAPNEVMEYASQGSFLEKLRSEGEILWTFFVRTKDGDWKVKDHARDAFYRFMSGWSVYLCNPARYGFADNLKDLPPPEIYVREIEPMAEQMEIARTVPGADGQIRLFRGEKVAMTARSKLSQAAKGFIYTNESLTGRARPVDSRKPGIVAEIVREDVRAGHQVLVWTLYDAESAILADLLQGIDGMEMLTGKVAQDDRLPIIERFRKGQTPVLITRASMLGHGLNFQNCTSMVFSGFDDSFERYFQAVRRAYRYGQTKPVRVHIPYIKELEGVVWDNIQEKQAAWDRDTVVMERCYVEAMRQVLSQ